MAILSSRGVKPDMKFVCCDCSETFTGEQVINNQVELYVVKANREEPIKSTFRCECCQDEHRERVADMYEDY